MSTARRLVLTLAIAACRPGGAPPITSPGDACIIAGRTSAPDSVILGVAGRVETGYVLRQRTRAESVVVAHVYETLVRAACDERIVPALAEIWVTPDDGRSWSFTLRADAMFSDGTAVTAANVIESWRERRDTPGARPDDRARAIEGVTVESDRRITVHFREAQRDGPRILADPYYSVHRRVSPSDPPVGSGGWLAPRIDDHGALRGSLALIRLLPRAAGRPTLVLAAPRAGDQRDLIDGGVDVMLTHDPRILEYAATRTDLRVTPLRPDRAYVFITTSLTGGGTPAPSDANDPRWGVLRSSLARDVIRGPVADGRWWGAADSLAGCTLASSIDAPRWPLRPASARTRRIVYPSSDRLAGDLASRLVAIAAQGPESKLRSELGELVPALVEASGGSLIAVGLESTAFATSIAQGDDLAYVLPLPRRALDPCLAWRQVANRSPWLVPAVPVVIGQAGPSLISSANAPDVMVDWDNTLRIAARGTTTRGPR